MADASVRVVVNAITDAAESAMEQVGDEISEAGRSARGAARGLASLGDEIGDAAERSVLLSGAIEGVGAATRGANDNVRRFGRSIDDVGDEAVETSGQLAILQGVMFTLLDVTDSNVHGIGLLMSASSAVVPVLVALVAALVPLIGYLGVAAAGFTGLALGMSAVLATGIVADLEGVTQAVKDLLPELQAIATEFGSQFTPLIYDAIDALPILLRRILENVNGIEVYKRALQDLGSWAMTGVPAIVDVLTALGVKAMPVFYEFADAITSSAEPALNALVWSLTLTADGFREVGAAMPGFMSSLLWIGTQVLQLLLPAFAALMNSFTGLYQLLSSPPTAFEGVMSILIGQMAELFRNIGRVYSALQPLIKQIAIFLSIVIGLAAALLNTLAPSLVSVIGELARIMRWVNMSIIRFLEWKTQTTELQDAIEVLKSRLAATGTQIKAFINQALALLMPYLVQARDAIAQTEFSFASFGSAVDQVKGSVEGLRGQFTPLVTQIQSQLGPALSVIAAGAGLTLAGVFRGPLFASLNVLRGGLGRLLTPVATLILNSKTLGAWAMRLAVNFRFLSKILRNVLGSAVSYVRGVFFNLAALFMGKWFFILSRLSNLIKARLVVALGSLGSALVSLLPTLGTIIAAFGGIPLLLTGIAAALVGLYIAWQTNFWGIRDVTFRVLSAIKALLRGDTSEMQSLVGDTVYQIQQIWKRLNQLWRDSQFIFTKIFNITKRVLGWVYTNAIVPILNSIMQHWNQHGSELKESFEELYNFLKAATKIALGVLYVIWDNFGDEILAVAKFAFDLIGSVINTFFDVVLTLFDVFTDALSGDWEGVLNKLWGLAKRIFGGIARFIGKWGSGLLKEFADLVGKVIDWFLHLGQRLIWGSIIPNILGDIIRKISNWKIGREFSKAMSRAVSSVRDYISNFKTAGKDLIGSLVKGIRNKIDAVKKAAKDVAAAVDKHMPGSDADEGPLSNLSSYGPTLTEMIARGISSNLRAVEQAASSMAHAAMPSMLSMRGLPGGGGGTTVMVGGITVTVNGDADGERIGRGIARGLDDELRSRTFN